MVTKGVLIYTVVIALALYGFCAYQVFGLALNNITSNENLRERWNANDKNKDKV